MPPRKSSQTPPPSRQPPSRPAANLSQRLPEEVVDPVWLLKALGVMALAAIVCAWLALCLLYYQGSWQLVLRPSHSVDQTPSSLGIPFEQVHFDASETGQPRLSGWWIAAAPPPVSGAITTTAKYAAGTILYLHDGSGSLSAALPTVALLHSLGVNVFAFDYRGFGASDASSHPTSETMTSDAAAALNYLTSGRHVAADHIVPYGTGLGAALAAVLAKNNGELPAVVLDNPDPDPTRTAIAAHPSGIVPIRLLYHEHFEIAGPLATLPTPKLLVEGGPNARVYGEQGQALQSLLHGAASPTSSVTLPAAHFDSPYLQALSMFLDRYLPSAPAPR
jgi:pimeloyl-ACP methyl ester carboxylesterase